MRFAVGAVDVLPDRNLLRTDSVHARLEPKVMDVLCALAGNGQPAEAGRTLDRATLIDAVWGVEHGADESLTRAVSILRRTFREIGVDTPVVETISKRGYCLCAPVAALAAPRAAMPPPRRITITLSVRSVVLGLVAALLVVGGAALSSGLLSDPPTAAAQQGRTEAGPR